MDKKLPNNWVETKLGQTCSKPQYGWTSKSSNVGLVKYLRTTDLSKGSVNWDSVPYCLNEPDDVSKYELVHNDIVVSRAGSVGLSYRLENPKEGSIFASYLIRFKALLIEPKWIQYFLKSPGYWNQISKVSAGIAVQNINATKLAELSFPLPPLPEQKRIVTKLDGLFAHLEKVKTRLEMVPKLLKDFRRAVLTQAVTGKLTSGDDWKKERIEDLTSKVGSGSTPRGGSTAYKKEGIPLVRSMNIHFHGIKYDGLAFIDEEQAYNLRSVEIFPNDVLLNITGASIGRVCLAEDKVVGGRVNQHVSIIRSNERIKSSYLNIYLASPIIQNFINDENYGVTRQALTKTQILNIEIDLPAIEEQNDIILQVQALISKADKIEARYYNLRQNIELLPQTFLTKAFKGELTEQLPGDGGAWELLEEIKKLKIELTNKPKKKKFIRAVNNLSKKEKIELLKNEIMNSLNKNIEGLNYISLKKGLFVNANEELVRIVIDDLMAKGIINQYYNKEKSQMMIKKSV